LPNINPEEMFPDQPMMNQMQQMQPPKLPTDNGINAGMMQPEQVPMNAGMAA
jgi:hypothetical protein